MSTKLPQPEVQVIRLHKNANGMGLSIVAAKGAGQVWNYMQILDFFQHFIQFFDSNIKKYNFTHSLFVNVALKYHILMLILMK